MNPVLKLWYAFLSKAYVLARTTQLVILGTDFSSARQQATREGMENSGEAYLSELLTITELKKERAFLIREFSARAPDENETKILKNMVESRTNLLERGNGIYERKEVKNQFRKTIEATRKILSQSP